MDPLSTRDGKPYGPFRYEQLVQERYFISKTINTSYNDTGKLTPTERRYILKYMIDEIKQQKEQLDEMKKNSNRK